MDRVSKDSPHLEALGAVDELNSQLGVTAAHLREASCDELLERIHVIQSRLFDVGSHIATPLTTSSKVQLARCAFPDVPTEQLELWMDQMDASLPKLTNFVMPGGGLASSSLHVCRTLCRAAERRLLPLVKATDASESCLRYLNRLSDFFFVASRFVCLVNDEPEVVYQKLSDHKRARREVKAAKLETDKCLGDGKTAAAAGKDNVPSYLLFVCGVLGGVVGSMVSLLFMSSFRLESMSRCLSQDPS